MDYQSTTPLAAFNHVNAGLVAGTTLTTSITTAPSITIGGKFGTVNHTAGANQAITPTLDANTGVAFPAVLPNTTACLLFGLNAAGTLVAALGPAIPTETGVTTTVGAFINAPQFPAVPSDFCPIAYTLIRVAPSGTSGFTVGVTSWAASSMSCTTFKNIDSMPARPQIA